MNKWIALLLLASVGQAVAAPPIPVVNGGTGTTTSTGSGSVVLGTGPTLATPTVTGSFTATGLVTNADLANSSVTVNGTTCTLGSTCSPGTSGIVVGSTGVGSGTNNFVLTTGTGTLANVSPSITVNGTTCTLGSTCSPSGSGSVTAVSVASANGFAGSSSGGTTPALTLSTSITGALKGNGTAISQAACSDLSNGATGCSTATGTSGATIPLLNGTNVWSGQQSGSVTSLAISTATFTPDGTNNDYTLTLVHASCPCTLANPSATPVAGTTGVIVVKQSATGTDTIGTWGSQYLSPGGTASITLSTGANAVDVLSYFVQDATHILLFPSLNFSH